MPRSFASAVINAESDAVWAYLRDFDAAPDFVPAVATSEIEGGGAADQVGCVRRLVLGDGAVFRERLVALSDVDRSYTYHIVEGPLPITAYYSTIRVSPVSGGASFAEWWSTYDCESADAKAMDDLLSTALYGAGLAEVAKRFA